jgi:flagellar biosynthetic protein FlhB
MSEDDSEREHEPTPQKLDAARRRGDLVRSAEISTAASYAGFLAAAFTLGPMALGQMGEGAVALTELRWQGTGSLFGPALGAAAWMLLPAVLLIAVPAAAVIAAIFAQRAFVVAPEKLEPRLSRVNPLANAAQKFGPAGLAEFARSLVKLVAVSLLLGHFILRELPALLMTQYQEVPVASAALMRLFLEFLSWILALATLIAAFDWLWQRHEFLKRNRMTRQELLDDMKQSEGDPHVKGQRRRRAEEIAQQRMLTDVPRADVVIVNPTHYAVALQWKRGSGRAPVCVAKGVDEMAARIRECAATSGVPIRSDPPAARALYASVDIGGEILPEHYAPVAAAIRFAETMRGKARRAWR